MRRKKIILGLLVLAAIVLGYISYISWFIGFAAAKYCGAKHAGKSGRIKSIIIPWRKYELHLHHWVIACLASAICAVQGFYLVDPALFYGFLGGLIFQGVYCYND